MKPTTMAVLGAGTMGHGIAQVMAGAGWVARVHDPDPATLATCLARVAASLETFKEARLLDQAQADGCLERIVICPDLETACRGVDLVIEAAPEKLEIKQALLARVEGLVAESAILATNTSAISISEIARGLKHPGRLVGTHFWNPGQVLPCVEVVRGEATSDEVFHAMADILRRAGKEPVLVNRDLPGFLGNRLQHALQREAMSLVEQGVCSPEDLDKVVCHGFGLRLAIMGPLERSDLGGLDVTLAVQSYLLPYLDGRVTPSPLLREKVEQGELGLKTGRGFYLWDAERASLAVRRRDKLLLQIIRLRKEASDPS